MRRILYGRRVVALFALVVIIVSTWTMLTTIRSVSASKVYTIAQVQNLLTRTPRVWTGRTISVRGWLIEAGSSCAMGAPKSRCQEFEWEEIRADMPGMPLANPAGQLKHVQKHVRTLPLIVTRGSDRTIIRVLSRLQRFPSVNRLLHGPITPRGQVYHIQLLPPRHCRWTPTTPPCPNAILLDAP